ncbi:MAG TPA: LamG domain-containing protein, partial [Candidatus Marinimicrobia bacterium]|nr:LamG domain-containing protein [Candidatus Neomarinimicrobiota bacterium]
MNNKRSKIYLLATLTVALFSTQSLVGQSLSFDGVDDYVVTGSDVDLRNSPFSIETWYKSSGVTVYHNTTIIDNYGTSTSSSANSWVLHIIGTASGDDAGKAYFGKGSIELISISKIDDGIWHHIAIERYDDGSINMFVDGILNDTETLDLSVNIYSGYNLFIGSGHYSRFQQCVISEVMISKQNAYYSNFMPPPTFTTNSNTVLHLKIDEGSGTNLTDLSTYSNDGTISGATWSTDTPGSSSSTTTPDYKWFSSDSTGGPVYSWEDITSTGTLISMSGDDNNTGPHPIGFSFPFYGTEYTTFRISTNGWISFTSTSSQFNNEQLPAMNSPEAMLAPFWDDLNFQSDKAYYYSDGSQLVVTFNDVPRLGQESTSSYTFQVILKATGEIVYQYNTMTGPLNGAT